MNGIEHIETTFSRLKDQGRTALMPYFTLGYPTRSGSVDILEALSRSGADLIELGAPFSDPLADGPTIQHTTQVALEQGLTLGDCLEMVCELRRRAVHQPLLMMAYINPLLSYGIEAFAAQAAGSGVDGLIIPDLPIEEAGELMNACRQHRLALVFMLAPTSSPERIALAAQHSTGFLYLVSVTGVTGARQALPDDLAEFIQRVRSATTLPLVVGFGIATPDQARAVGELADGVIVGSALIQAVQASNKPGRAASHFTIMLRESLDVISQSAQP